MAENVKISGEIRTKTGSSEARRLRRKGRVPGNVYGRGGKSVMFTVAADKLMPIIMGGQKVLEMDVGGETELTLFQEIQWDTFGTYIRHIDLLRVDRDQKVTVDVLVELRGIAPGTASGGVVAQRMRTLSVECPAFSIPESIAVRIGSLEIGDEIRVSQLEIEEGIAIQDDPETIVVQVNEPVEELPEEEEGIAGPAQPEVIGRAADDDEDE